MPELYSRVRTLQAITSPADMSRTLRKELPAIKLCGEENKLQKRKKIINACCDNNFTRAVGECCWNITNGRVALSPHKIRQLRKHKTLLRKLSDRSVPVSQKQKVIQTGSGFATLLPLLLGPILAGVSSLIKRK